MGKVTPTNCRFQHCHYKQIPPGENSQECVACEGNKKKDWHPVRAEKKEGWGFPGKSRKAHYFVESMSLCRRWGFYSGVLEQGKDDSPDNCSACMKALTKKKAKIQQ